MKRSFSWLALTSFYVFGGILLFQMATEESTRGYVIHQKSNYAIINVSDPEIADALASGEFAVKTDDPNAKTIIRVTSGIPTRVHGDLKSNGQLLIINPAGIIVGPGFDSNEVRSISLDETDTRSTLDAKMIPHGNVYALAIREAGSIRAVEVVQPEPISPAP